MCFRKVEPPSDLYRWTWGSLPDRRQRSTSCSGRRAPAGEWTRAEGEEESRTTHTHTHTHTERESCCVSCEGYDWLAPCRQKEKTQLLFLSQVNRCNQLLCFRVSFICKSCNETNQRNMTKQNNIFYDIKELILSASSDSRNIHKKYAGVLWPQ